MNTDKLFATTLQKTHVWLEEIMSRLGWEDPHRAWSALRAVLHALRDRLTVEDAAALGAQLPMLVRGAYYEGWSPSHKPERIRHEQEFLDRVADELQGYQDQVDLEEMTRVVFDVLTEHVSFGEAEHLFKILPKRIGQLLSVY